MNAIGDILVIALLAVAAFFTLVGSFGLLRFRDTLQRLHGPTKATTLGVGSVLIAAMLHRYLTQDEIGVRELLFTLFVFLTAPIAALRLAKAALIENPRPLPPRPDGGTEIETGSLNPPPD